MTVYMFHGVSADDQPRTASAELGWELGRARFAELLDEIASREPVLDLDGWLAGREGALLSLDDGFLNHLRVAAPILLEKGLPAVFFPALQTLRGGEFPWPNRLWALLDQARGSFDLEFAGRRYGFELDSPAGRHQALTGPAKKDFAHASPQRREAFCQALGERIGAGVRTGEHYLDEKGLRRLCAMGFEIGSHGDEHRNMVLNPNRETELRRSKLAIEALTGRPCRSLAWPFGAVDARCCEVAQGVGYEVAFSVKERPGLAPRFAVARVGVV